MDDLLANSLKGHEEELAKDIEAACNEKKGLGKYVEMFKITTWTDHKLQELWCLHSYESFAERHRDVLKIFRNLYSEDIAGNSMIVVKLS